MPMTDYLKAYNKVSKKEKTESEKKQLIINYLLSKGYEYKLIKDKYGEKMMHFCRSVFPTILETPGLLFNLLDSTFAHSKFLYEDLY